MSDHSEKKHSRWNNMWTSGIQPGEKFDALKPLPALSRMVHENLVPTGRALVPGCGRGYDVVLLASPERHALGLDIADVAVSSARQNYNSLSEDEKPPAEKVEFSTTSFFDLPEDDVSKFDFVYDYTFLCALDPSIRPDWAEKMAALVKPGGELCTIIFPIGDFTGGPPFAVDMPLYKSLLESAGFTSFQLEMLPPELCHPDREGKTAIGRWRRNVLSTTDGPVSMKEHPRWGESWDMGVTPGTRFDAACPLPALVKMVGDGEVPVGRALVPGCGRGYDVTLLASPERVTMGLDIAEGAIKAATERFQSLPEDEKPPAEKVVFSTTSFFDLPEDDASKFDFVYDYTFLCALDPSIRPDWAEKMAALVKPGGELCTIIFPIGERTGGPPFAVTMDDYRNLLEPLGFQSFQLEMLPKELCHKGRGGETDPEMIKRMGVPVSTAIGRWRKH